MYSAHSVYNRRALEEDGFEIVADTLELQKWKKLWGGGGGGGGNHTNRDIKLRARGPDVALQDIYNGWYVKQHMFISAGV